jgi:hypothetical protein
MNRIIVTIVLILAVTGLRAQSDNSKAIGFIETTKNWYYIYDQNGRRMRTLSTSQGELKGYSSTFYILKEGTAFYITFDVNGRRIHTFGTSTVGEVLAVTGDNFTSRQGPWLHTWTKDGKKLSTRAAQK